MPLKGLTTQCLAVLLSEPVTLDRLEAAIPDFPVLKRLTDPPSAWPFGGPGLVVGFRPEVNGYVSVDVVDHPWPDDMGDPQTSTTLFGAWSMGFFGPFAYPGGLARAGQQAWAWEDAQQVASRHKAFLRVLSSYSFGAEREAPVMPPDYLPLPELDFVTRLTESLLRLPEALCYYNPNGERLLPRSNVRELLAHGDNTGPLPLELWSNVRLFNLGGEPEWLLMDTVGMSQLDAPDHEACFEAGAYAPDEVSGFLHSIALYRFENGPTINDGDTVDGPGEIPWQGATFENGLADPPREVIRWLPMDDRDRPAAITGESTT